MSHLSSQWCSGDPIYQTIYLFRNAGKLEVSFLKTVPIKHPTIPCFAFYYHALLARSLGFEETRALHLPLRRAKHNLVLLALNSPSCWQQSPELASVESRQGGENPQAFRHPPNSWKFQGHFLRIPLLVTMGSGLSNNHPINVCLENLDFDLSSKLSKPTSC